MWLPLLVYFLEAHGSRGEGFPGTLFHSQERYIESDKIGTCAKHEEKEVCPPKAI
jgi:hypothetical protein